MEEIKNIIDSLERYNKVIPMYMRTAKLKAFCYRYENFYKNLKNKKVLDLGGGLDVFNLILVKLGFDVTVVDFFNYDLSWKELRKDSDEFKLRFDYLRDNGIKLVDKDLIDLNISKLFEAESFGLISSYHCLEHFKQSPVPLLKHALHVLSSKGLFLIEVPNSINLLKRIKVLLGKTNYCNYYDYACAEDFTGHIREYSMEDLQSLCKILKIENYKIYGRNYFGSLYEKYGENLFTISIDKILCNFPSLCGSLYLKYIK